MGYGYIDAGHAEHINSFYREFLNPYLNYHRPCAQAEVEIDQRGRKRVRYKRYRTPFETLLALDKSAHTNLQSNVEQSSGRIQYSWESDHGAEGFWLLMETVKTF